MTAAKLERQSHAVLDLPSRYKKALKIDRLLQLSTLPSPIRMLEIGTGSGGIAHYFAQHRSLNCEVTAVDVMDQRLVKDGYQFVTVQDTRLPFRASSFDVVLSNHVIEHVGDTKAQIIHLNEIHRVLKKTGIGYLAVPNRWMLIEPHFRLPFLSWLPDVLRTPYLRLMKRGVRYDCNPLTIRKIQELLDSTGFSFMFLSTKAIREMLSIEGTNSGILNLLAFVPSEVLDRLAWINPTLIYRIEKS